MSHQIIYTSCMRGIDGVNDGQQIYSYNMNFRDCKSDEIKGLFGYQVPALPPGITMTEEIAEKMPGAFSYRLLDSGRCAVTLNTYLGRDYMGSTGRFGNHLSHSVVYDFEDFNIYPCELYGSSLLRSHMTYEEVNNPKAPPYLSEPMLEKGYKVDLDRVIEFLSIGDNFDYYKNMFYALLRFEKDRKRIVICDDADHIIMWIAALQYTLPLEVAKKINFTTYEFDPELSPAQICGVIPEGTRYNAQKYLSTQQHFLFDFIEGHTENFNTTNSYFDFIEIGMRFSYDSLLDFHDFVRKNFNYTEADDRIFHAYTLYEMETQGFENISQQAFEAAVLFAKEYATDKEKIKIVHTIIKYSKSIYNFTQDYTLCIMRYLLDSMEVLDEFEKKGVKQIIVDIILNTFSKGAVIEKEFVKFYDELDSMAQTINLCFASELVNNNNRIVLLQLLQQGLPTWKENFIIQIISQHVIDSKFPTDALYPNRPIGNIYFGILKTVFAKGNQDGLNLIEHILNQFKGNSNYLVNMALTLEGYLGDITSSEMDTQYLWHYFNEMAMAFSEQQINEVYKVLNEYERHDEMYALYSKFMEQETNLTRAREIFNHILTNWFSRNPEFKRKYINDVSRLYGENLLGNRALGDSEKREQYIKELLVDAIKAKIEGEFVDQLAVAVVDHMPLKKPNKENAELIDFIVHYQYMFKHQKIRGKLLLISIGMMLDEIKTKKDFEDTLRQIGTFSCREGGDLRRISEKDINHYFEWIIPFVTKYCVISEDMMTIYDVFQLSPSTSNDYMQYCCKEYYKRGKSDKDYSVFCEFLIFMFEKGDSQDRKNLAKELYKLKKYKKEELNKEVNQYFKKEIMFRKSWNEIVKESETTNPLMNGISNLFKRKKD